MADRGKIVLFFPSYATEEISPPLALIAIAGPLLSAGFDVRIIDSALHPDFLERTLGELDGALCLGVSLITGPMIADTIAICKAARARHPDLPIVLGGWHPSILPEQTVRTTAATAPTPRSMVESSMSCPSSRSSTR